MATIPKTDWLQVVCKWRTLLAGWQLGTRPKGEPESDAVRDHRELSILLRVESSAIGGLLIAKGVVTAEELHAAVQHEAEHLSLDYEARFPGVTAGTDGLSMNPDVIVKSGWMRNWRP